MNSISSQELNKILPEIQKIAQDAGNAIMEVYHTNFAVEVKADASPLTMADKKANEIIVKYLQVTFSMHGILSEESKDDKSRLTNDYCWVVDPLDGTKEFVKRNGEFTVNIALTYQGESILGVIYAPARDEMYFAARGCGAFYQTKKNDPVPIHVSNRTDKFRITTSRSHKSEKMLKLLDTNKSRIAQEISIGSSFKGCLIAKGDADLYYRFGYTMEWDTAAMQCVVEEAGGFFRQMDDSPMRYNRENNLNDKGFYILNNQQNDIRERELNT